MFSNCKLLIISVNCCWLYCNQSIKIAFFYKQIVMLKVIVLRAQDFDTTPTDMETLDEQLDAANARLTEQSEKLAALETEIATLQATNEELSDNLTHTKEQLASVEGAYRQALEEVQQLKAEAKSAEERAAEYYGKPAAAQPVTAKGDPDVRPVSERFAAIKDPAAQTAFLRSLSDAERAELYNNL